MEDTQIMNEQQPVENKKDKKNNTWKHVAISGAAEFGLGAASTILFSSAANDPADEVNTEDQVTLEGVNGTAQVDSSVPVAHVSDDMSFGEAFASAHDQVGPGGVFVWHGQVYGTYTADEWNSMTPSEHAEYGSHVHVQYDEQASNAPHTTEQASSTAEVVAEPGAAVEDQPELIAHVEEPGLPDITPEEIEIDNIAINGTHSGFDDIDSELCVNPVEPEEPEVEVLAYETISNDDGSQMDLAVIAIDGQEMGIYDVNQDGTADLMAIDANNNQQLEENEILDISAEGVSMQALHEEYIAQNDPSMEGPDYINDGDIEGFIA